jgi:hypothetical protein
VQFAGVNEGLAVGAGLRFNEIAGFPTLACDEDEAAGQAAGVGSADGMGFGVDIAVVPAPRDKPIMFVNDNGRHLHVQTAAAQEVKGKCLWAVGFSHVGFSLRCSKIENGSDNFYQKRNARVGGNDMGDKGLGGKWGVMG